MPHAGVADLRAAVEEGQVRMQGAVESASEEVARREQEIADKRVVAAEKDILLQSQMGACPAPQPRSFRNGRPMPWLGVKFCGEASR